MARGTKKNLRSSFLFSTSQLPCDYPPGQQKNWHSVSRESAEKETKRKKNCTFVSHYELQEVRKQAAHVSHMHVHQTRHYETCTRVRDIAKVSPVHTERHVHNPGTPQRKKKEEARKLARHHQPPLGLHASQLSFFSGIL